jgi:hypothetical protein
MTSIESLMMLWFNMIDIRKSWLTQTSETTQLYLLDPQVGRSVFSHGSRLRNFSNNSPKSSIYAGYKCITTTEWCIYTGDRSRDKIIKNVEKEKWYLAKCLFVVVLVQTKVYKQIPCLCICGHSNGRLESAFVIYLVETVYKTRHVNTRTTHLIFAA